MDNLDPRTSIEHGVLSEETRFERHMEVPKTSQHNGVAESRNKFFPRMVRCTMARRQPVFPIWEDALPSAAYILNRVPTKS